MSSRWHLPFCTPLESYLFAKTSAMSNRLKETCGIESLWKVGRGNKESNGIKTRSPHILYAGEIMSFLNYVQTRFHFHILCWGFFGSYRKWAWETKKYFALQEYKNCKSTGSTTEEQCHSLTKNFVHVDGWLIAGLPRRSCNEPDTVSMPSVTMEMHNVPVSDKPLNTG